jgi:methylated-DNA-protein-cysteine methyltransferase-like protein
MDALLLRPDIRFIIGRWRGCCADLASALPWHRVVGAGGEIKLRGEGAAEQRLRLNLEGVRFRGKRVDMDAHEHVLRMWEVKD